MLSTLQCCVWPSVIFSLFFWFVLRAVNCLGCDEMCVLHNACRHFWLIVFGLFAFCFVCVELCVVRCCAMLYSV